MTHRFPIKEIALQAGMSTATVDRALNKRANVSPQTARRVQAAVGELIGQEQQLSAMGRRMFIDIIVEAPSRFSREVRSAIETVLPTIGPVVFRPRFLFSETLSEAETIAILRRIAKRGSHGVCLKVRDLPSIRKEISALIAKGIPIVTMFTDIGHTKNNKGQERTAYVGLNNKNAGRTAAYLISHILGKMSGAVLTTRSQSTFTGEVDRAKGFADALKEHCPNLKILDASGGGGLSYHTAKQVTSIAATTKNIIAVYSMGGGNKAMLKTLKQYKHEPRIYVAHDLDDENTHLLKQKKLTYVLYHDLRNDMRNAFLTIAAHHKLTPEIELNCLAEPQIITPENIPEQ